MSNIREIASSFECIQIAMTKDKNGYVLKLSIHPNDVPEDLLRDIVGTRYQAALVRVSDQGQPVPSVQTENGLLAVRIAGTLCGDERFQQWLAITGSIPDISEQSAVEFVRHHCGISSRSELKTNAAARDRLFGLRDDFTNYLRSR